MNTIFPPEFAQLLESLQGANPSGAMPNGLAPQGTFSPNASYPAPVPSQRQQGMQLLNQAGAIPNAPAPSPAFRTPDLIGLLGTALVGPQFGAGFIQGKQGQADQNYQIQQQDADRRRAMLSNQGNQLIGSADRADELSSRQSYDANQSALDRGSREKIATENLKADASNREAARLQQKAIQDQNTATQLQTRYTMAKSLDEMKTIAKRYNSFVPLEQQYDDATIERDYAERKTQFIDDARNQLGKSIDRELNQFGEVSSTAAAALAKERDRLADVYKIPRDAMQSIPTGQTLKSQLFQERKKEFAQNFDLNKTKWAGTLANRLAELDLAERRLQYTQQHGNAMLGVAQGNLGVAQGNLAIRQYDAALKAAQTDQTAALKKVDGDIAAHSAALKAAKAAGNDKKVETLENTLATLRGRREFVVGLLPAEAQAADLAANAPFIGTGNQVYNPQVNPVTSQFNPNGGMKSNATIGGLKLPPGWGVGRRK